MRLTCILALLASAICTHRSLLFGGIEPASETSVSAELQSLRRQREELTKENNRLRALEETKAVPCLANSTTSKPEDLFVQRAPSCHFTHGDTGTRIVFDDMSGVTSRFTDRPYRKTSRIATLEFFESYDSLFGQDLPNGAIMMMDVDGTEKGPYITTMAAERVDETFVYLLTQSSDQTNDADIDSIPGNTSFENCVIFIDDVPAVVSINDTVPELLEFAARATAQKAEAAYDQERARVADEATEARVRYDQAQRELDEEKRKRDEYRSNCNLDHLDFNHLDECAKAGKLDVKIAAMWTVVEGLRRAALGSEAIQNAALDAAALGLASARALVDSPEAELQTAIDAIEMCGIGYSYPGGSIYETLDGTDPLRCWTKCNEEENCLFWDIDGSLDSTCRLRTANSGGKVATEGSYYGSKGCVYEMCGKGHSYPGGSTYKTLYNTDSDLCWTACKKEENCLFWDIEASRKSTCRLRTANSGGKVVTEGSYYGSKGCFHDICGRGHSYPGGSIYKTFEVIPRQADFWRECYNECKDEENCLFWDLDDEFQCRLRTTNSGGEIAADKDFLEYYQDYYYGSKDCLPVALEAPIW